MKKALEIIKALLMTFVAVYGTALIYSMIEAIFILFTGMEEIDPQVDYCLMVLAIMISVAVISHLYKKNLSVRERYNVDLKEVFSWKNIIIYLAISLGCQLFASGALALLRPLLKTLFESYDETISSIFISDTIIVGVYVVILTPIFEELIIRGILFNRLRYTLPFYVANIIQALVFGIYHLNLIQGIYAFGFGLVLGYVYEKTRTLWASILVHMLINGSAFLIMMFNISINEVFALIAGGFLLFFGLVSFSRYGRFNGKDNGQKK